MKKTKLYRIEKGIKVWAPKVVPASVGTGAVAATVALLEKGDSFLVKDALEALKASKVVRDYAMRERARGGKREFTTRKDGAGVRIWRVA